MLFFTAAFKFLLDSPSGDINREAFNEASGIGVVVNPEQIETAVSLRIPYLVLNPMGH